MLIIFSTKTHGFVGETHHFRTPPPYIIALDVFKPHSLDLKIYFLNATGLDGGRSQKAGVVGSWLRKWGANLRLVVVFWIPRRLRGYVNPTVTHPANQLRGVVYPIIYMVLRDFLHQQQDLGSIDVQMIYPILSS